MSDERATEDAQPSGRQTGITSGGRRAAVPSMSKRLEDDDRHPVLIFGSSQSGKSTMILSFINAIEKAGRDGSTGVHVSFGRSFYATRDQRAEDQMADARRFYDVATHFFISDQQKAAATQVAIPFFLPLDLHKRQDGARPVRLAILDGRGEWYLPNYAEDGASFTFQNFDKDIVDVLRNYTRGISIICVAPFSHSDSDLHDTTDADAGLMNALDRYHELRPDAYRSQDSLLFLLSKWDQEAMPQSDQRFQSASGVDIVRIVEQRFARSWDRFRSLPIGPADWDRRSFMQYSSCQFIDGVPRIQSHLADSYHRYPRTVVNWMYGNARRFERVTDEAVERLQEALFADVAPEGSRLVPLPERFLRALVRR